MKKATIILLLICGAVFAQQKGTFIDPRDKKTYKTVKIGSQTWMAENLNYHGEDGYLGLCYGDMPQKEVRKPENCKKYGRLYDWKEAMKACPSGWHLPSDDEWQKLVDIAGGNEAAGAKLKAKSGWNNNGYGTDGFGFSALPGGNGESDGSFDKVGYFGYWWSATEDDASNAYLRYMYYDFSEVYRDYYDKSYLFSVRCAQD